MRHLTLSRIVAAAVTAGSLAACSSAVSTAGSTATPVTSAEATTLLTRLGADTVAIEQFTRTATRMEGVLVNRMPFTLVSRYSVELAPGAVPTAAEYSLRKPDGGLPGAGAMQALSVRFNGDSVTLVGHRSNGDTTRTNLARGNVLPYVNNAYGLWELGTARLLASGRDSLDLALVPLAFAVRNTSPLPMKRLGGDSVRVWYFGSPFYVQLDRSGNVQWMDGRATTVKVRVDRVANTDVQAIATAWAAREQATGAAGPVSTRDTVRASVGGANLWVDYGRPALRGRDVWVNGVLGDTLWRTGANAATQLHTDADLLIGGQTVPAGTYSLWTWATRNGYHLVVNKQFGQWGTEYHPDRDLIRVPLREGTTANPAERFTIAVQPGTGREGTLVMTWGTKTLSVPIAAK